MNRLTLFICLLAMQASYLCAPLVAVEQTPKHTVVSESNTGPLEKVFMYELIRYLYRWYLDADDLARPRQGESFVFWARETNPPLDVGDKSQFAEIMLPTLGLQVMVKNAKYSIAETGTLVQNDGYRVVTVTRLEVPSSMPDGYSAILVDANEMMQYLFQTRNKKTFPDEALLAHMRGAVSSVLKTDFQERGAVIPQGEQIIHLAPLSEVANEVWIFWETGRTLIRIVSDIDWDQPAFWLSDELFVDTYDLDTQVVVSMNEAAGSNAYLTRDQIGRVLYNCVVLGKRSVVPSTHSHSGR